MNKGALFKTFRVVAVLATALVIAIILIRLSPKAERQIPVETGRLVDVMQVKSEQIHMTVESYGTVTPREVLKLVAEVRGQIVGLHPDFKEGGFLKRGAVIIRIDPRTYQLEVKRQKVQVSQAAAELRRLQQEVQNLAASIEIAESDVALAKKEVDRLEALIDKNVIAQTTLDQAKQRYLSRLEHLQSLENQLALTGPVKEQLEAQREMAKVTLRQAELDLERSSVTANFNAWVLEKTIEEGQHVNTGQHLGSIYREGALDIEVRIAAMDLKWLPVDINQRGPLQAKIISVSGGTRHVWKGRVARIKARMEEKTRTLPVVVEVAEAEANAKGQSFFLLRPGVFVTVEIMGKKIDRAFILPRHVVYPGDVVYTVRDNRLAIKPVNILRSFKDSVIIDEGLTDGELVIKTPLPSATDGMLVRLKE
jgi:multidrug efflux pump subunit AcrA (membrane-fusion protein)